MLGWSINLFRIFGIRLAMHFSFPLLLAWVAWEGWIEEGWAGLAANVTAVLILFTCVVLHELGHSLTARRYGVGVPRILLLPFGGMAEFDSIPRRPRQELLISLAGPAVNFAIVLVLLPFLPLAGFRIEDGVPLNLAGLSLVLFLINLAMGCFNLLPVFPMDGGRVLRALLAMRWPYLRATFWAAAIGKVLAVAGVLVMALVFKNPMGTVLFAFIFIAGDMEYRVTKRREAEAEHWARHLRRLYELELARPRSTTSGPTHRSN